MPLLLSLLSAKLRSVSPTLCINADAIHAPPLDVIPVRYVQSAQGRIVTF